MEKTLSLSEAKMKLNHLVDEVVSRDDEFIITRNGQPAAVLIPASLYEGWKETQIIKSDKELMKEIKEGLKWLQSRKKGVTFEDIFEEKLK